MTDKEKLKSLQIEFSELFTQREYNSTTLTNSVYAKYLIVVGRGMLENFKLDIELKQWKMKVKLALQYVNQGLPIDYDAIEHKLQEIAEEHQEQLKAHVSELSFLDNMRYVKSSDVKEAKEIYRMIVRELHPDLHPELYEELQHLLLAAQSAYKTNDIHALRQIAIQYNLYKTEHSDDCNDLSEETIKKLIGEIEEQISIIRKDIEESFKQFPLKYEKLVDDPKWIEEQKNEINSELERLQKEIETYRERYNLITECDGK